MTAIARRPSARTRSGEPPGCRRCSESAVENSCKVFFPVAFVTVFRTVSFWKGMRVWGAPGPLPLKGLTGAGFCKKGCKILSASGLEVKFMTTKDLPCFSRPLYTPLRLDHDLVCLIERARSDVTNQGAEMRTAR